MRFTTHSIYWLLKVVILFSLPLVASANEATNAETQTITVFKSPTCGCCGKWIDHLQAASFSTSAQDTQHLQQLKMQQGIAPQYQSCHTGVSESSYVFEGHVPAELVTRFLNNPPEGAIGLAVPGMPIGSPGMEMGGRLQAYDVLLLDAKGGSKTYARVTQNGIEALFD